MASIENVDRISFRTKIRRLETKQIPFAAKIALNNTAWKIRAAEISGVDKYLDRPKPFSQKAYLVKLATKRKLVAIVYMKKVQAGYLFRQVEGGIRKPERKALKIPVHIRLNKFGNIPKKRIPKLLSDKKRYFSGVPKGRANAVPGIYQRLGTGANKRSPKLKLLVFWGKSAKYEKKLPFVRIANAVVEKEFRKELSKAIDYARRTAK